MADLNVQPKQKKSLLPWLLLALGLIALIFFLMRGCNNDKAKEAATDSTAVSTPPPAGNNANGSAFGDVDFNAPSVAYDEITDKNIDVRGNNNFGIYGLGENILFDEGKNTFRGDAKQNLKQIATSIAKRYKGASVRFTATPIL
jgi:outer membrane protein OmpA-like peptidoglycan-associated protein